jgi:hypothetical protein
LPPRSTQWGYYSYNRYIQMNDFGHNREDTLYPRSSMQELFLLDCKNYENILSVHQFDNSQELGVYLDVHKLWSLLFIEWWHCLNLFFTWFLFVHFSN